MSIDLDQNGSLVANSLRKLNTINVDMPLAASSHDDSTKKRKIFSFLHALLLACPLSNHFFQMFMLSSPSHFFISPFRGSP